MSIPAAIVVPFYKNTLLDFEEVSLKQCFKIFKGETIIAIKPPQLDISTIAQQYPFTTTIHFDEPYFTNIAGYNRLLTSEEFYGSFLPLYEYILIYQLDAFVFRNELQYWCKQRYDYIGAPWMSETYKNGFSGQLIDRLVTSFNIFFNVKDKKTKLPLDNQFRDRVGNGGFSLRKVQKLYKLVKENKRLVDFYLQNQYRNPYFNEDVFWSIEMNRRSKKLSVPSYKIAVRFAFEDGLERALKLTKGNLPFGCHDWDRNITFWRPVFAKIGYDI